MLTTANTAGDELRGKAVIINGSSSAIGLGIADAISNVGMNVVLNVFGDEWLSRDPFGHRADL